MRRLGKFSIAALIALVVMTALIGGIVFDRLVDEVLRPWVVTKAATSLGSEVDIDSLVLGWGRLEAVGVRLERPGELRLRVDEVIIEYNLTGLWNRRLKMIAVRRPELEWKAAGEPGKQPLQWPPQPPVLVREWKIEAGRLSLKFGKNRLLVGKLAARGMFTDRLTVEAEAVLGSGPGVSFGLSATGSWEGRPELTITALTLSGDPLLREPVTLSPEVETFAVSLSLPQLDAAEAARLLSVLDRQPPWPPGLDWEVSAPRLFLGQNEGMLSLRLETAAGEARRPGDRWPWESLRLDLAKTEAGWSAAGEVSLPAKARLDLKGIWREERFRGKWELNALEPAKLASALGLGLPTPAKDLRELNLKGDLQAAGGTILSDRMQLSLRLPGDARLTGVLSGGWQEGAVRLEATGLKLGKGKARLATASLKLSGRPEKSIWRGTWHLQVPDARKLLGALPLAAPGGSTNLREIEMGGELKTVKALPVLPGIEVKGLLAGSGLSGRVSARMTVRKLENGWGIDLEKLAGRDIEYLSSDGLGGVAGGSLEVKGSLAIREDVAFALRGAAGAGEALAGSWYGDLSGLPLAIRLDGRWEPASGRVRLSSGSLDLAGLAEVHLKGEGEVGLLDLSGELSIPRLDGEFLAKLRQLAADQFPGLEGLELTGGLKATGTGIWHPSGWALEATLRPEAMTLGRGESVRITGLFGELPLLLQRGEGLPISERSAALRWNELRAGPLFSSGGTLRLRAAANRWQFVEPLRLAAGGGWLELADFTLSLPAPGPEVRAAARATGIDLAEVSRTLGWPEMGGRLGFDLPDIRYGGGEISTGGEALLQVFDGTVRVANMRIKEPFSPYPTYHADVDFSGINLQPLTRAFSFGEMNGVADGSIHDLRLLGAVPSAFSAIFETREKGTRNISVKALRNLNTLSQGGISAALSQGIYRFIDFYRYRKIGIRCWLKNDVFHLEGTAKPGTDTYLIYGGWLPPRIDVIVSTPTISFREMVARLKRIERAGR